MYLLNNLVGGMNPTTILVYLKSPFICIFAYMLSICFSVVKSRLRTPHSLVFNVIHNYVCPLLEYIGLLSDFCRQGLHCVMVQRNQGP